MAASDRDRARAYLAVGVSTAIFALFAPFAKIPLLKITAFIAAYDAALITNDLITALLLLGPFKQTRSLGSLLLACGYLFDALMVIPHALSYPELFAPAGLFGNAQTTAWLYMFWHAGFPLFVIGHALLRHHEIHWVVPPIAVAVVLAIVCVLSLSSTSNYVVLPEIMDGNHYTPLLKFVIGSTWAMSFLAFVILWRKRAQSVLDLWLMVVMCAWVFDIALSGALNAGRYDLGFYSGRIFGLVAATFVLIMLVIRTSGLNLFLTDQLTRLFDTTVDLIVVLDARGDFIMVSPSSETILGYRPDEMMGRNAVDFIHPEDLDHARREMWRPQRVIRNLDCRCVHKNGGTVSVSWTGAWEESEKRHFFIGRDITDRQKLEEQLRQSQKIEAIGRLTGGMAHDFNNMLGVIIGNIDLLLDITNSDPEVKELATDALDAASRAADLTRRLLAFARQQPLKPELVNVNDLVKSITKLLQRTLGEQLEITLQLADDVWPIVVDPVQFESAITNLATNARDAMSHGGHLVIGTKNACLDAGYAELRSEVTVGDYTMIEVSDDGTGMTPDVMARIFEPFFTTKSTGQGTGLGLSMVFGFVKQSGGHISVYSEPGIGTTFRLYFPRAATGASQRAGSMTRPVALGRGETILVVEDNPAFRQVVVKQLSELRYNVLAAENVAAALGLLEQRRIDLLLSDIVMPGGQDGLALARQAQARWPMVKIILTSGFSQVHTEPISDLPWMLLSKPYRRDDLARVVSETLKQKPAARSIVDINSEADHPRQGA